MLISVAMLRIPRKYSHFLFGAIQAGLTSLIAAGIASFPLPTLEEVIIHWLGSWLVAWAVMLPVVLLAAPTIRRLAISLTRDDG